MTNTYNNNIHKWSGKNVIFLGDSITWYDGNAFGDGTLCKGFPSLLNNIIEFNKATNIGVSGASMAHSSSYPSSGSILDAGRNYPTVDYTKFDVAIILAGTNDFKLNVNMGTIGLDSDTSWDDTTFYGAYRHLIETMISQNPTIKIYMMTPLQRNNGGYDCNTANTATPASKLSDYCTAIKNIGQMYGIPVLDLYSLSGFTRKNLTSLTIDSLHPNNLGHQRIADLLITFIENN